MLAGSDIPVHFHFVFHLSVHSINAALQFCSAALTLLCVFLCGCLKLLPRFGQCRSCTLDVLSCRSSLRSGTVVVRSHVCGIIAGLLSYCLFERC